MIFFSGSAFGVAGPGVDGAVEVSIPFAVLVLFRRLFRRASSFARSVSAICLKMLTTGLDGRVLSPSSPLACECEPTMISQEHLVGIIHVRFMPDAAAGLAARSRG